MHTEFYTQKEKKRNGKKVLHDNDMYVHIETAAGYIVKRMSTSISL